MPSVTRLRSGAVALALTVQTGLALAVVDQVSPLEWDTGFNVNNPENTWQQEVQTGMAGVLTGVDLYFHDGAWLQDLRFFINRGTGWQAGRSYCLSYST